MKIENAAWTKTRKATNVAVPVNPAAIRSIHPDHFGRRASIRIGTVALLEQALRLAAGKLGIGIAPDRELTILLLTPDVARFSEGAFAEAGGDALRHDFGARKLNQEMLAEAAKRIIVRTVPETRRGRQCVETVDGLIKELRPDLLILHDASLYFSTPRVAVHRLRRGLGLPVLFPGSTALTGGDACDAMEAAPGICNANVALYTPLVLRKGMPDDEAGPAAWVAHQPSVAELLRNAALSITGQRGLYHSHRSHRVIIFSPHACSPCDMQTALTSLLPDLSPPSAAWNAVHRIQWIPVPGTTLREVLADYLRAEADACRADDAEFIIVLWQFQEFRLVADNAARFLSRAILGYESVISY